MTLDTGCVNAKGLDADLNTLERWAAGVMLTELSGKARVAKAKSLPPHPDLFTLDVSASALDALDVLAGPDLPKELRQILFPTAHALTDRQRYDVEHLRLHVRTGGDVFVTLNSNDFVKRGRQKTLHLFGGWWALHLLRYGTRGARIGTRDRRTPASARQPRHGDLASLTGRSCSGTASARISPSDLGPSTG